MKDFWKRKRNKRIAASALAVVMAGFLVWGLFPWQAAAAKNTVADDVTINKWHKTLDNSTKNVGRIWTDKSVSTGDVTLTNKVGASAKESATIEKGSKSDFLVGLSALSSTAKIMGQTTVPLDIVLVLDVSGSMDDQGKMTTLKTAVNSFIDTTAAENDKRSDTNKQSRISLVKFAGEKKNTVGNDTYKDGGYIYNYTQIVSEYEAYTSANKKALKDKVAALNPAGATSADYGMEHAKTLVKQSKDDANRKNAKRIVIFFTDGEPNHGTGFNETVANTAIKTATGIKSDADIYTIGVFNDADASITGGTGWWWTDKEQFNAYMHGMSSNYPNATAYYNLGTRAPDSNFYKAAKDASTLNTIFDAIAEEIVSSALSPTHVDQGESPNQGGYITFTDQLGDYMQVDDMNALVYANTIYTYKEKQESSDKSTITYTYEGEIKDPNHVYPEGNLNDIKITVKKSNNLQTGDLVTVMIPANMIPLRYYEVSKGKMTISETYPMRLFYDVSLKADAEKKIENPDEAMQAYINANKNGEGQVQFYSNKYKKEEENGKPEMIGAYSHFVPATTNDFYYFQEDAPLYTDEECKTPAKGTIDTSGNTTYYYQRDYYEMQADGTAVSRKNTVTIPGNSDILVDGYAEEDLKTGEYYIRAGAPRTTSLSYFTENKAEGADKTGTASTFIKPTWDYGTVGSGVTTYLGNNGKMTFDLPGELDITKTVTAAGGHAVPDSLKDQEFTYTLQLTAKEGVTPKGEYTAQKYTGTTVTGDEFTIKSGDTFTLKDRQTLKIYGLESGTTYTVTETKAAHFTGTAVQTNAGDNPVVDTAENGNVTATGTITGNQQTFANYTNTYKADPGTLDGSANLKVKKEFQLADGTSAWDMEYLQDSQFTFLLTANSDNAPLPEDAVEIAGIKAARVTVTGENDINKAFGNITFTEPGTYKYRITEQDPRENGKQGVVYSQATYTVTVTVTDENGTLNAVAEMKKTRDDNGTELAAATVAADKTATFKNVYDADSESVAIRAAKNFTDHTGSRPLEDGQYTFRITPETAGAPLPEGDGEYTETTNRGVGVEFKSFTFTAKDAQGATENNPKTYEYTLEEVLPQGANEANKYTVNGITYDPAKYTIQLKVYIKNVAGEDTVVVDRIYKNDDGTALAANEVPEFHNSYKADSVILTGDTALKGEKTLTGRDMLSGETFDFTLTAGDDSTKKALKDKVVTIAENGDRASVSGGTNGQAASFNFGNVTFTKDHTYTVREVNNDLGGVTYDDRAYTVRTTITDNRDGTMNAEHEAYALIDGKELAPVDEITFTNKYEAKGTTASIGAVKRLTGKDLKDGQFTFQLKDENGKVIDEAKNNKAGAISFKALEFDKAGTYKYTISEVNDKQKEIKYDTSEKTVTITVKDSGDGYLQAQVESEKQLIFTNTFEAAGGSGTKTGDNMNLVLPIMMMLTAAAIGSVLLLRRKYHR